MVSIMPKVKSMEEVLSGILMAQPTLANGLLISAKAKVNSGPKMAASTQESGLTIKSMVEEVSL